LVQPALVGQIGPGDPLARQYVHGRTVTPVPDDQRPEPEVDLSKPGPDHRAICDGTPGR
jgi:hypothetical protein